MFGMFSATTTTTTTYNNNNNNNSNVNQQLSISIHKERDKDNRYYEEEWNIAGKKTKSSPRYLKYHDNDVILYPFSAGEGELPRPPGYPRPGGDRGPGGAAGGVRGAGAARPLVKLYNHGEGPY